MKPDLITIGARIARCRQIGVVAVRIWLTPFDAYMLIPSTPKVLRFCGVPVTIMDVGDSRIVFQDGSSVPWG